MMEKNLMIQAYRGLLCAVQGVANETFYSSLLLSSICNFMFVSCRFRLHWYWYWNVLRLCPLFREWLDCQFLFYFIMHSVCKFCCSDVNIGTLPLGWCCMSCLIFSLFSFPLGICLRLVCIFDIFNSLMQWKMWNVGSFLPQASCLNSSYNLFFHFVAVMAIWPEFFEEYCGYPIILCAFWLPLLVACLYLWVVFFLFLPFYNEVLLVLCPFSPLFLPI